MNINLDLSKTTSVETASDGKVDQRVIRKVSRFVVGNSET